MWKKSSNFRPPLCAFEGNPCFGEHLRLYFSGCSNLIYVYTRHILCWEYNGSLYPCQLSGTVVPGFDNTYCCIDWVAFCEDGIQACQFAIVLVLGLKFPIYEALLYIRSCWTCWEVPGMTIEQRISKHGTCKYMSQLQANTGRAPLCFRARWALLCCISRRWIVFAVLWSKGTGLPSQERLHDYSFPIAGGVLSSFGTSSYCW